MKLIKQEIKLSSILALEIEVNGLTKNDRDGNPIYRIPGLLDQKMQAKIKYWLTKLSKTLTKERKGYEDLRNDLIKKYGVETKDKQGNSSFEIPNEISDPEFKDINPKKGEKSIDAPMIKNPNTQLFIDEQLELLKQVVEVDLPKFEIEELFCFETEHSYSVSGDLLILDSDPNFIYQDL